MCKLKENILEFLPPFLHSIIIIITWFYSRRRKERNCQGKFSTLEAVPLCHKIFLFSTNTLPFFLFLKKNRVSKTCSKCSLDSNDNIINELLVTVLSPINSLNFQTGGILGFMLMEGRILFYTFLVNSQCTNLMAIVWWEKTRTHTHTHIL